MASIYPNGRQQYFGSDGLPLAGGKLWTYATGTTTKKTTWQDREETIENTNPVILNARGEALVYLRGSYKFELRDAADNIVWTTPEIGDNDIESDKVLAIAEVNQAGTAIIAEAQEVTDAQIAVNTSLVVQANAARDAAYVNANVYASTAAGLAAVADGVQFQVVNADGLSIQRYRRDSAVLAATVGPPFPTSEVVARYISGASIGYTPTAVGSSAGDATYYWPGTLKGYAQRLTKIEVGLATSRSMIVVVATLNGDGTLTLVSRTVVAFGSGAATASVLIDVPAGCVVGLKGPDIYYDADTPSTYWYTNSVPSVGTAKVIATANSPRLRFTFGGSLPLDVTDLQDSVELLTSQVGEITTVGFADPLVSTGSTTPAGYTAFDKTPADVDGTVSSLKIGVSAPGNVTVWVATVDVAGYVSAITGSQLVEVSAGVSEYAVNLPIAAGQLVGVTGQFSYQSFANPEGRAMFVKSSAPVVGNVLVSNPAHRYELQISISTKLLSLSVDVSNVLESVAALKLGGISLFQGADNTGAVDATTVFSAARLAHQAPQVPKGSFSVASLASGGDGYWGAGDLTVAGVRHPIPSSPKSRSLYHALRAQMMEHIANKDVLTVIGDSISHWAYAATANDHWFNMLTRFVNAGVCVDEPIMTALRPLASTPYLPSFYGVTISGGTTGTKGPLGEGLILAAGDYIEFTGVYEQVDVFAQQASGAGTLSVTLNGAAAYGSKSFAGAAANDVHSGFPVTGSSASGVYRITASVAAVEITGLIREGVKAAMTGVGLGRLRTLRAARGSYTFGDFSAARTASVLAQASHWGGKAVPVIALGTNDQLYHAPEVFLTNAIAMIDRLEAADVSRIYAIPPMRPTASWNAPFGASRSYEDGTGKLMRLYRERGVTVLPMASVAWADLGFLQDGLHPNSGGNRRMFQIAVEHLGAVS